MSDEGDNRPINENEKWHASLMAAQLIFQRALFSLLIERRVITSEDARKFMFSLAESIRRGGDIARTEEIAYYFAGLVEELSNEFQSS